MVFYQKLCDCIPTRYYFVVLMGKKEKTIEPPSTLMGRDEDEG
jgi:hypothetical protein